MTAAFLLGLLLAAPEAPAVVTVATSRGDVRIPVRVDGGGPMLSAAALAAALAGRVQVQGGWAEVEIARRPFRLMIGAPIYTLGDGLKPLIGSALVQRDSLFLPLHFVTYVLPSELVDRYVYRAGRLEERPGQPALAAAPGTVSNAPGRAVDLTAVVPPPPPTAAATAATRGTGRRLANGLARGYVVAIDPGHGGVDPGNPGIFFPRGLKEKDVALQMGLLVRQELLKRGVGVVMTRTSDTLIDLRDRGRYCTDRCDLFVSLHVNSLARRPGYTKIRGFETYFLAEAKTEDAARVAKMENEALRFEEGGSEESVGGLDFILRDLQLNEYLRESARLAELIQSHAGEAHSGPDKGVKQAGLVVLTTARRPAVLFEMGFSTNPEDARVMTDPRSQRNLAASVADAIVSYLLEYQRRVGGEPADTESGGSRE